PGERESSAALVRGMVASYVRAGGTVRGFDAVTTSDVPPGCGLSSSAAFEVMMGALVEGLFGGPDSEESASRNGAAENPSVPVELAQAGTPVPLDAVNVA
ncbi:hypothetical protein PZH32_12940, partial [Adlercreutzia equolifaciens]|nr:hypothetical protein [Adlercreutzia equolifaciens]